MKTPNAVETAASTEAENITPMPGAASVPVPVAGAAKANPKHRVNAMRHLVKRGRVWYYKQKVQGEIIQQSLGTEDLALAKAKRDEREAMATRNELKALRNKGVRRVTSTLEEVCAAYEKGIAGASDGIEPASIKANMNSLKSFVRWAKGSAAGRNEDLNVDGISLDELTADAANKFKTHYVGSAGTDRVAIEARRRGAKSVMMQARSMFSDRAMTLYRELVLPELKDWRAATLMKAEDRVHRTIEDKTRRAMHERIMELKLENPRLWLVHVLAKFAGLRNDELCSARVEWFQRAPWGQVFICVVTRPYFEPKGSEGHVPLATEVAKELYHYVKGKQPLDFLIEARSTEARFDVVNREHAAWIRQFLPKQDFSKAGYELRRMAAQAMDKRYGKEAAEAFLRHSPQTVAERHYLERYFPWTRFGENVGIRWEDVNGGKVKAKADQDWKAGAEALKF